MVAEGGEVFDGVVDVSGCSKDAEQPTIVGKRVKESIVKEAEIMGLSRVLDLAVVRIAWRVSFGADGVLKER